MKLKKNLVILGLSAALLLGASAVLADGGNFGLNAAAGGAGIPTGGTIPGLIGNILKIALGFVGTLFLLLMVYAGFLYMTARGDEKKVSSAKQMIVGAVIGVVIIAAAYAITSFVLTAATGGSPTGTTTGTGTGTGTKKATGETCTADAECANNVCQPAVCTQEGTSCTSNTDCTTPGDTCDRRCQ